MPPDGGPERDDDRGRGRMSERRENDEVEIDLGRWVRRVVARWYIVLAAVVVAVLIASLGGTVGKQTYSARALIYLGQPYTPNGQPISISLTANPAWPGIAVRQQAVVDAAAAKSGMTPAQIRAGLSAAQATGAV